MSANNTNDRHLFFRVALVGAHRPRVAKVLSLIESQPPIQDHDDEIEKRRIHVEYVPCVATFDSYENEKGDFVKYLMKLEHHGKDGQCRGASLASFFDDVIEDEEQNNTHLPGISGVSIGVGIELDEEVEMITNFMNSISGRSVNNEKDADDNFIIKCIKPNAEYSTMKDETLAYKNLSPEDKEAVTMSQQIGPGKMAKFTMEIAKECIPPSKAALATKQAQIDAEKARVESEARKEVEDEPPLPSIPKVYDPSTTRFACKMCRTILFNDAELEDPPHAQSQHSFSSRKTKTGANVNSARGNNKCQSFFLADALDWMGDISFQNEGKLACPKCSGKLGLYKWHGTQCSCGTWVVPAIMIHKSRVDVVPPQNELQTNDPLALLKNPLARLHVGGQI